MSVENVLATTLVEGDAPAPRPSFLSKARIIARPGFNRWLVPRSAWHGDGTGDHGLWGRRDGRCPLG